MRIWPPHLSREHFIASRKVVNRTKDAKEVNIFVRHVRLPSITRSRLS